MGGRSVAATVAFAACVSVVAALVLDPPAAAVLRNTLVLAAVTVLTALPLGIALAWLLTRTDLPGRRAFAAAGIAALFVPLYLHAAAWQAGFGLQGWAVQAWSTPPWMEGWFAAVWVHALAAVPWTVLFASIGFRAIEPELEEQAMLDAPPRRVALYVTARNALPALVAAAGWTAIAASTEISVTDLFGIRTFAEEVYTARALGTSDLAGWPAVVVGLAAVLWLVAAGMAVGRMVPAIRPPSFRPLPTFPLGRAKPWAIAAAVTAVGALVAVPVGNLVYWAGIKITQTDVGLARSWSPIKAIATVVAAPIRFRREFAVSFALAAAAATLATLAAGLAAWLLRQGRFRGIVAVTLAAIALAVPGPLLGIGLIHLLNRPEVPGLTYLYDHSMVAPCLALTIRGLGPALLILWFALRTFPAAPLDAATLDGAGPAARFGRIVFPARRAAFAAAWLTALAVSLAEVSASILVMPPGPTTVAIRIFGLLHYGVHDQVAGICLAQAGLSAVLALVVCIPFRQSWRPEPVARPRFARPQPIGVASLAIENGGQSVRSPAFRRK